MKALMFFAMCFLSTRTLFVLSLLPNLYHETSRIVISIKVMKRQSKNRIPIVPHPVLQFTIVEQHRMEKKTLSQSAGGGLKSRRRTLASI